MKTVLDFVIDYWYVCLAAAEFLLFIVYLILSLIIKKTNKPIKVLDTLKGFITSVLPALICEAENKFTSSKSGKEKRQYVLESCEKLIGDVFPGYKVTPEIMAFMLSQVEVILSTPTKKGVR